uniref:Macaca fascicularis brain cDNA, clone: QmoA-11158 n=1 Tax=Macaca fascicularis TaxID=9541 RepID=I7GJ34_MACFA|nr:unnamed protein product [Macaca fascicularis]
MELGFESGQLPACPTSSALERRGWGEEEGKGGGGRKKERRGEEWKSKEREELDFRTISS